MSERYYLSDFKVEIEEVNERCKIARIYIEYRSFSDVSSELHEIIVYRNADGIAVIESDIYDSQDYLNTYLVYENNYVCERAEKEDVDLDNIEQVIKLLLKIKLEEMKEQSDDEELNEKIEKVLLG